MEILGIVWAASIINPSVSAVSASGMSDRRSPHQNQLPLLEGMTSWLNSLTQGDDWTMPPLEVGAYSSYVSSMSWLAGNLSEFTLAEESSLDSSEAQFTSLVPAIGSNLGNFEGLLADGTTDSTASAAASKWSSWNAVASVRLEDPHQQSPVPETSYLNNACLQEFSVPYQASPIAMTASPKTQIWVHNHFIGDVSGQAAASKIVHKLRTLLQENQLDPAQLIPLIGSNFVGIGHNHDMLFVIDETMRSHPEVPATAIAVHWINNLRRAFGEGPLSSADIQMASEGFAETSQKLYGTASWYGPGFHGRQTANGEIFDENELTAAHKSLPFDTHLKVTNRLNGRSVVVRINDRGPYIGQRSLDLSKAASRCLGSTDTGVVPYEAVILEPIPKPDLDELTTAQLPLDER